MQEVLGGSRPEAWAGREQDRAEAVVKSARGDPKFREDELITCPERCPLHSEGEHGAFLASHAVLQSHAARKTSCPVGGGPCRGHGGQPPVRASLWWCGESRQIWVVPLPGRCHGQAPVSVVERSGGESPAEGAFERLVEEGDERLSRAWLPLIATGLLGGVDVGTGVLAYFVVQHYTHNALLAGLAFSVGFVALLLARSELFTENFLVPVVAVAAGHRGMWSLLRLWALTLGMNLVGGWVITWLIVTGRPDLKETAVEVSAHYFELGFTLHSFVLAVLAGTVITLMTRMQHATDNLGVQLIPAIVFGALLAGGQLFHSVLDSLFMFAGLHSGSSFGYLDWLGALGWSALGNLVGGVGLVTTIRLVRTQHRVREERADQAHDGPETL